MSGKALIIGNSDGIGLAATTELIKRGWAVVGISRSESKIEESAHEHYAADAQNEEFVGRLKSILNAGPVDLCLFCAGIGELLNNFEHGTGGGNLRCKPDGYGIDRCLSDTRNG